MSVYVVRHGQTDWNKNGWVQGRFDVPLNDTGRAQAKDARDKLLNVPFEVCFVSPLSRAKETAEIILKGRDVPMICDNRLVEMAYGIYEGTHWMGEEYQRYRRQLCYRYPEGESYFDVAHRAFSFLDELKEKHYTGNVLLVCHGGIGRAIESYFDGTKSNDSFIDGLHPNGSVQIYEFEEREVPVVIDNPVLKV